MSTGGYLERLARRKEYKGYMFYRRSTRARGGRLDAQHQHNYYIRQVVSRT
jgi:hypothetical protein